MKITVLAVGTLGSVQPFIALGSGLVAAGHDVKIATNTNLEAFVRDCGLSDCVSVVGDTRRWTAWLARGRSREKPTVLLSTLRRRPEQLREMLEGFFARALEAASGSDLVISSATGFCVGQPIARKLGVPHCSAFLQPFHPTRAFPQLFWPQLPAPVRFGRGVYNLVTHRATLWGLRQGFASILRMAQRRVLGTSTLEYEPDPLVLYGYSPSWIPKPRDWGTNIHVTGYWFLDRGGNWTPPPQLAAFLAAGPPPVYVGFGSLAEVRPEMMDMAVAALGQTGQRGVIATGWSAWHRRDVPDGVLVIDGAPHEWLFPRVDAVIHHAGTGTVGAGLRAGRPTATIPVMYDHFFFAHHIHSFGLGPAPMRLEAVCTDLLRDTIVRLTQDRQMRRRAADIGERIRSETGVTRAVELIGSSFA